MIKWWKEEGDSVCFCVCWEEKRIEYWTKPGLKHQRISNKTKQWHKNQGMLDITRARKKNREY